MASQVEYSSITCREIRDEESLLVKIKESEVGLWKSTNNPSYLHEN